MFGLGTTELIIIGVIVFLIFGAKRIPDIGKGLGGALREFRQIVKKAMDVKKKVDKVKKIIE
jgi:sec-independent protein translocase protein TatA